jgi:hypothetical protein
MKIWTYVRSMSGRYALTIIPLIAALSITVACDQPGQSATTNHNAIQVSATPPGPTPTEDFASMRQSSILTEQAYEGAYATHYANILTESAPTALIFDITHTAIALGPTMTPLPVFPTATPRLGLIDCQVEYYSNNCWVGTVNGQPITVVAGRLRGDHIASVLVFHSLDAQYTFGAYGGEYYPVPCDVYSVGIASISGTLITITPLDYYHHTEYTPTPAPTPIVLVFDLATRQWVSSTCGPLPNQTATP